MTLSRLVVRSMRKNIKHYYLYFFALIFSVTLCFSFTTLQYNPTVIDAIEQSGMASVGFSAASYILYFIVTFFVLYANHLFMKKRSKELGLYRLIGMTKGLVVRLVALENLILFLLAISIGLVFGFLSSRFFAMVLMKLLEVDLVVQLVFSQKAFNQSVMIFSILLIVIVVQLVMIIRKNSLLSLFSAEKKADERIKQFNLLHMILGMLGFILVVFGYYKSTVLFNFENEDSLNSLLLHMLIILGSTIFGTFLFFRYSVGLMMNLLRSMKKGHLKLHDVVAVTPIMHRMKGNAMSLTLITILTGFAVGIMSLSYISYYSSETNARQSTPYDYVLLNNNGIEFMDRLYQEQIDFTKDTFQITSISLNIKDLVSDKLKDSPLYSNDIIAPVISISDFQQIEPSTTLNEGDAFLTSYADLLSEALPLQEGVKITTKVSEEEIPLYIKEVRDEFFLYMPATYGSPVLVVTDKLFQDIRGKNNNSDNLKSQIGINLLDKKDIEKAEAIYSQLGEKRVFDVREDYSITLKSYKETRTERIATFGLTIFVTAFLGLAFLLTTGSILYFKQVAEAEEERESYRILRRIGFSTTELISGIYRKQLFNFGVPLVIGLLHSYFAVKSGWFLFGTELVIPLVITMSLYVAMYAIFALFSTQYYKKVIQESL